MKTTRRRFLKGLIASLATGIIAPQVLIESVHGASDLTPQERDVVADVMGLRQKQWRGVQLWKPKTLRRTTFPDGCVITDKVDDWEIENAPAIFAGAKTELLIDGEWENAWEVWAKRVRADASTVQLNDMYHVKFTEAATAWSINACSIDFPIWIAPQDGEPTFQKIRAWLDMNSNQVVAWTHNVPGLEIESLIHSGPFAEFTIKGTHNGKLIGGRGK